jgi:hypothetical protein
LRVMALLVLSHVKARKDKMLGEISTIKSDSLISIQESQVHGIKDMHLNMRK